MLTAAQAQEKHGDEVADGIETAQPGLWAAAVLGSQDTLIVGPFEDRKTIWKEKFVT